MGKLCGAKNRSGGACKRAPMANGRCKFHGGASLVGPAHPNWKGGRHSKYLPKHLLDRYAQAEADPRLLSLRSELALMDARVSELLEGIGTHGGTKALRTIRDRLTDFKQAGTKGRSALGTARVALQELEDAVNQAMTAAETWEQLHDAIDLRRKLAESETKQMKDLQQMISVAQMTGVMGRLLETVMRHVSDPATRRAISTEFARLVGGAGAADAGTGGA